MRRWCYRFHYLVRFVCSITRQYPTSVCSPIEACQSLLASSSAVTHTTCLFTTFSLICHTQNTQLTPKVQESLGHIHGILTPIHHFSRNSSNPILFLKFLNMPSLTTTISLSVHPWATKRYWRVYRTRKGTVWIDMTFIFTIFRKRTTTLFFYDWLAVLGYMVMFDDICLPILSHPVARTLEGVAYAQWWF